MPGKPGSLPVQAYTPRPGLDGLLRPLAGSKQFPSARFVCIHHEILTKNKRGLEYGVERNEEGVIVSQRQREGTLVNQTDCKWSVRVSYEGLARKGSNKKAFILTVISLDHSGRNRISPRNSA
jgi:hypothetical protein